MNRTIQIKAGTTLLQAVNLLSDLGEVQMFLPHKDLVFQKDTIVEYKLEDDDETEPSLN